MLYWNFQKLTQGNVEAVEMLFQSIGHKNIWCTLTIDVTTMDVFTPNGGKGVTGACPWSGIKSIAPGYVRPG